MNRASSLSTLLGLALLAALAPPAAAHDHVPVGDGKYELTIGWITEPPLADQPNAVSLRVVQKDGGDGHHGEGGHGDDGGDEVDVKAHGALFDSGNVAPGESFTWNASHDHVGMTIPYHCHFHAGPGNTGMAGNVTVSMDAEISGEVVIGMSSRAFWPAEITVQPGTVITWTNNNTLTHTVTSGVMKSGHDQGDSGDEEESGGHGHSSDTPVEGLAESLSVRVTIGGKETTLGFRAKHGDPGHYLADIMPTVEGTYSVHITGDIDGTPVDVTTQIQEVESPTTIAFPEKTSTLYDLERRIAALEDAPPVDVADVPAEQQRTPVPGGLVIVGLLAAAVGLAAGAGLRRRG